MRSVIFAVAVITLILAAASFCAAEESGEPKSEWSFQLGYSPQYVAVANLDEGDDNWHDLGLQHGGSVAFEWRSKGRWGVQVPVSAHHSGRLTSVAFGVNAVVHFREHGKTFDPYAIMGGTAQYFRLNDTKSTPHGIVPMVSLGLGARYYVNKHVGFYTEAVMNTIIIVNSFQGRAGLSFRF